ncbi:MAG: BrnA antitoxin family protein [Rhodocyclaceae bacterium]
MPRIDAMSDKDIDYSDAPETDTDFWKDAAVNSPAVKRQVTLRIDPDIVDFFKASGQGYQTRINAVLRSYVKAHERK